MKVLAAHCGLVTYWWALNCADEAQLGGEGHWYVHGVLLVIPTHISGHDDPLNDQSIPFHGIKGEFRDWTFV